jgi:hypothetical protein
MARAKHAMAFGVKPNQTMKQTMPIMLPDSPDVPRLEAEIKMIWSIQCKKDGYIIRRTKRLRKDNRRR